MLVDRKVWTYGSVVVIQQRLWTDDGALITLRGSGRQGDGLKLSVLTFSSTFRREGSSSRVFLTAPFLYANMGSDASYALGVCRCQLDTVAAALGPVS